MTEVHGRRRSVDGGRLPGRRVRRARLEAIYLRLFMPLVRRARFFHRLSDEDARDVVQEAFQLAMIKMRTSRNASIWFERVVDRLARNLIRKRARRAQLLARWFVSGPSGDENEEA